MNVNFSKNEALECFPASRSIQSQLWELMNSKQRDLVAKTFRNLKNHVQMEVAGALIAYLKRGEYPDPKKWRCILSGMVFHFLLNLSFPRRDLNISLK